ncbi:hypothetical protein GCM10023259_024480 [Thermocatellispora tengchongensis]
MPIIRSACCGAVAACAASVELVEFAHESTVRRAPVRRSGVEQAASSRAFLNRAIVHRRAFLGRATVHKGAFRSGTTVHERGVAGGSGPGRVSLGRSVVRRRSLGRSLGGNASKRRGRLGAPSPVLPAQGAGMAPDSAGGGLWAGRWSEGVGLVRRKGHLFILPIT